MDSPHLHLLRMYYIFLHFLHSSVKIPVFQHYPKVAAVTSHRQQTYSQQKVYIELDNLQLCEIQIFRLSVDRRKISLGGKFGRKLHILYP